MKESLGLFHRGTMKINTPENLIVFFLPFIGYITSRVAVAGVIQHVSLDQWGAVMLSRGNVISVETVLWTVALTPLIEEYVFRKRIFEWLQMRLLMRKAFAASVLIFIVFHAFSMPYVFLINTLILGVICQYLFVLYRNIWRSVYVHALFNLLVLSPKEALSDLLMSMGMDPTQFSVTLPLMGISLSAVLFFAMRAHFTTHEKHLVER